MKSFQLMIWIVVLLFSASYCTVDTTNNQANSSSPIMLTYKVVDEELHDFPSKAGVFTKIIITSKKEDINKESLTSVLKEIHEKNLKRKGWKYESETTITATYAYLDESYIPGAQWVAMIDQGPGDTVFKISFSDNILDGMSAPASDKFGYSTEDRKKIFTESFLASRNGRLEAEKKYPPNTLTDKQRIESYIALQDRLTIKYKSEIAKKYKLTKEQLEEIVLEGITSGWPQP